MKGGQHLTHAQPDPPLLSSKGRGRGWAPPLLPRAPRKVSLVTLPLEAALCFLGVVCAVAQGWPPRSLRTEGAWGWPIAAGLPWRLTKASRQYF